jgi:rhodanese-related sulfurtransferase
MPSQQKTPVRRISLEDAKHQMEDVVFVDVRSATALKRNPQQVPSALHVPLKELDEQAKRLPRDRTLVTYCT